MAYIRSGGGGIKGDITKVIQFSESRTYDPQVTHTFTESYKKCLLVCSVGQGLYYDGSVQLNVTFSSGITYTLLDEQSGNYRDKTYLLENIPAGATITLKGNNYSNRVVGTIFNIS